MNKIIIILLLLASAGSASSQSDDKKAIERTILNYVEAFYEADTVKAYEAIAKDLAKRGYYIRDGQVREAKMSFEQFIKLAQRWKNTVQITAASPKKITVFDVLDKIASAKVEAQWGIDFFTSPRSMVSGPSSMFSGRITQQKNSHA
jgi:hypothetical protein